MLLWWFRANETFGGDRVLQVGSMSQAGAQHNPSHAMSVRYQPKILSTGMWLPAMSYVSGTGNQSDLSQHWSVLLGGIGETGEMIWHRWSSINPVNSECKLQKWSRAEYNQGEAWMMRTLGDSRNWVCSHSPLLKRQGILLSVCAIAIKKSSSIYQPWLFLSSMCVKDSFWTC